MRLVVTGGRGFIGSHFVEEALAKGFSIVDIDKMGYASHSELPFDDNQNYKLISSTINLPEDIRPEIISDIYLKAWDANLKGVTN